MGYVRIAAISLFVTVALVRGELASTAPSEQVIQEVRALIKALETDNFAARQQASDKLVEMGKAIHPFLNKVLDEDEELSAQQKSRIRDILIDDGAIIRLEKSSKLDQDQIEILQEMRTTLVKREESYQAGNELKKNIEDEELSDEALGLFVYSIVRQIPRDEKSEAPEAPSEEDSESSEEGASSPPPMPAMLDFNNQKGFEPYILSEILNVVLNKPQAGPETGRAFGYWVRDYILPKAFPRKPRHSMDSPDWQTSNIVKQLMMRDQLDERTFDELVSGMCRKTARAGQPNFGGGMDLNLDGQTVLPICYSRHCRSEHVGKMVQAIIAQGLGSEMSHFGFAGMGCLEQLVHSPKFNEGHARAMVQWLLPTMDPIGGFEPQQTDDLAEITGETFVKKEDFLEFYKTVLSRDSSSEVPKRIEERMRAWLKAHQDKPLLGDRPAAQYRYIRAEIRVEGDDAKLKTVWDVPLQPGVGQLLRKDSPSHDYLYVCQRKRPTEMSSWMGEAETVMPNGVYLVEQHGGGEMYSSGSSIYLPGEPEFSGQSVDEESTKSVVVVEVEGLTSQPGTESEDEDTEPKGKPARIFWATMILPIGDQSVSAEQLNSLDFWVERIVRANADRLVRSAKLPSKGFARYMGMGDMGALRLNPYHMPAVETQVRKLLEHSEPIVVAAAALVLSQWKVDFDVAKVQPLLESKDQTTAETAAEALAGVADPQGIRWIIGKMEDPIRSGTATRLLVKAATSSRLNKAAKKRWAAELIEKLLPTQDSALRSLVAEFVVVRTWTGEDYGYEPGADPAKNTAALKRYHEWAAAAKKGS